MPLYDIVALTPSGVTLQIQVKAINKGDWQLDAKHFLEIEYDKDTDTQRIQALKTISIANLVFVLIKIIQSGQDELYVASYPDIQKIVKEGYRRTNGKSNHFALRRKMIAEFKVTSLENVAQAITEQTKKPNKAEMATPRKPFD